MLTLRALGHLRVEEFLRRQAVEARLAVHVRLDASTPAGVEELMLMLDQLLVASLLESTPRWKEMMVNGSPTTVESAMLVLLKQRAEGIAMSQPEPAAAVAPAAALRAQVGSQQAQFVPGLPLSEAQAALIETAGAPLAPAPERGSPRETAERLLQLAHYLWLSLIHI